MYLNFAWRYFKAKKTTNAINIISWITTAVIAFSTMCQILVLSVFNGFEDLVKSLYANFYTDLRIIPASGKTIFLNTAQIQNIKNTSGVKDVSLVVEEKALLQNGELQTVVFLKGVDTNYTKVSGVGDRILRGKYDVGTADKPLLILGVGIENAVGVEADKSLMPLTLFLPKRMNEQQFNGDPGKSVATKPPLQSLDIESSITEGNAYTSGTFAIQQDFDNKYVITNLGFIKQQMAYQDNEYSAAEIKVLKESYNNNIIESLQKKLGNKYIIQTRYQQNSTLYNSMELEKWAVFAILTLILIIAAFNMVSALTMLVLEKEKDIAVLQAMGADSGLILKIFLTEGLILAGIGSAVGIIIALIISIVQIKFKLIKLQGSSFLIDYFPIKFVVTDFLFVTVTAFIIAVIASWFPAKKASIQHFSLRN